MKLSVALVGASCYDVFAAAVSSCPVLLLHLQVVRHLLLHMGHEEVTEAFGECLLLLVVASGGDGGGLRLLLVLGSGGGGVVVGVGVGVGGRVGVGVLAVALARVSGRSGRES